MARISSSDRREAIIHAALSVIQREGIQAATTRAIVAEADMPLASFHYAFRSRDEMLRELVASIVEHEGRAVAATLSSGRDVRTAVRAGLQAYFETLTADPNREQAMFELLHYSMRTEELNDLPLAQYEMYRRTASELLSVGADAVGATWKLPLDDVARFLVTFISGLTLAWLADRNDAAAASTMDFAADSIAALAEPRHTEPHRNTSPPTTSTHRTSPHRTKENTP